MSGVLLYLFGAYSNSLRFATPHQPMKEQVCFSAVDLDGMRFAEVPFPFGVPGVPLQK